MKASVFLDGINSKFYVNVNDDDDDDDDDDDEKKKPF